MNRWLKGQFVPKNPKKYVGNADNIIYRSSWERTFMSWADETPEILGWASEETVINYFDPVQNKQRRYYMDFQIITRRHDGAFKVTLIEIKPHKQTIKPRPNRNKSDKTILTEQTTWITNKAKWMAAKAYATQRGWEFKIITEKELYGGIDKGYKPPKPAR
jgi:hypothetical protein